MADPPRYTAAVPRDHDRTPYSADERRVAEWLADKLGVGGGDDPIGFVLASLEYTAQQRNDAWRALHAILQRDPPQDYVDIAERGLASS